MKNRATAYGHLILVAIQALFIVNHYQDFSTGVVAAITVYLVGRFLMEIHS